MIKIAQIIDKETKGLGYLRTYKDEIINWTITDGIHVFEAEVMEFDRDVPVRFIETRELSIDLDHLYDIVDETIEIINDEGQTVQQVVQKHIPLTIKDLFNRTL